MRRRIADAVFRGSVYRRPEIGLCVPASLEPVVWTGRRHVAKRIWGKKKETPVGLSGPRVCVIGLAGCGRGAEAFLEVLEQAGNRDESWRMAVVSGGEDTRREIEKLFRCRLQRLPASADAFRITREEIPCFEDLLFARRGRAR